MKVRYAEEFGGGSKHELELEGMHCIIMSRQLAVCM